VDTRSLPDESLLYQTDLAAVRPLLDVAFACLTVGACIALAATGWLTEFAFELSVFAIVLGVVAWSSARLDDRRTIVAAFVVACLVRIAVVLLSHAVLPGGVWLQNDDFFYDSAGLALAQAPWSSLFDIERLEALAQSFQFGYPLFVGIVYKFVGQQRLMVELTQAMIGAAAAPVAYWLASELYDTPTIARRVLWLSALFPFDVAWVMFLLKDTVLLLVFTLATACLVTALKRRSVRWLVPLFLLYSILYRFRAWALGIHGCAMILGLLALIAAWIWPRGGWRRWLAFLVMVTSAGVAIVLLVDPPKLEFWLLDVLLSKYEEIQNGVNTLGNLDAFEPLALSLSTAAIAEHAKFAVIYFLSPFWWASASLPVWYTFYLGELLIWFLFPFSVIGYWSSLREGRPLWVLVGGILLIDLAVVVNISLGNYRERTMIDTLFVVYASFGWEHRRGHKWMILGTYVAQMLVILIQVSTGKA